MACTIPTTGAAAQAASNISAFKATSDSMIEATQDALGELATNSRMNIYSANQGILPNLSVSYNPLGNAPTYSDNSNVPNFSLGQVEKAGIDSALLLGEIPINEAVKLGYNEPKKPGDLTARAPSGAPNISNPVLPDTLTLPFIADPFQYIITIPASPEIVMPEFTAIAPSSDHLIVPGDTFHWSETEYDSDVLQLVQTQVTAFLNGGVGIPDVIWDAIWDRATDKEDKSGIKLIQEINEEWGARGFSLPQGVQVARIDETKQKVLDIRSTLARDIAEKQAVHEIENLKFAVQQGIVLEQMLGDWYQQKTARVLDAAKFSYKATVELFNASVQLFNVKLEQYKTEAQVYQTLLQSAVTELEVYKAELDSQKLVNDINQQNVDIYVAKHQALSVQIDLYNSQLQAAKVQIETDTLRMQAYKTEVDAYGTLVAAKSQEYDAYVAQLKAEETKIGIYETEVKAFAIEMETYKTTVSIADTQKDIEFKNADLKLKEFSADLQHYSESLKAEMGKVEIDSKAYASEAKSYELSMSDEMNTVKTKIEVEKIRYADKDAQAKPNVATLSGNNERTKAETALATRANEAIAQINAQIGSAAMAAINVGTSMSDSASASVTCEG